MKVLIAEDEYCSRVNLIRQVKECISFALEEILEAENGKEAWRLFLEKRPELVLTDIKMPVLDGMALTEMIYKSQIPTSVIIVSGFAEFEYAQTTMRYGAVGYLLKPIQDEDLRNILRKRGIIRETKEQDSKEFGVIANHMSERLKGLITGTGEGFGREEDRILSEMFGRYCVVLLWMNTTESGDEDVETARNRIRHFLRAQDDVFCRMVEINPELQAIILKTDSEKETERFLGRLLSENRCPVELCAGVSGSAEHLRDIREYHKQAFYALSGRIFYPGRQILYFEELRSRMNYRNVWNPSELSRLRNCIFGGEADKAFCLVRILMEEMLKSEDLSVYSILDSLKMIEIVLNEAIFHFYRSKEDVREECPVFLNAHFELMRYSDAEKMLADLCEKITQVCRLAESSAEKPADNTAQLVIDYIRENYNSDITLKYLAENVFFLNSSYLSHLLKSKTGKNYLTYLTEVRMEKAAELIEKTDLTVTEIAGMCGYNDISKFIQVFKKYYGKTPGKYREKE